MSEDEQDRELGRVAAEISKMAGLAQKFRRLDYWLPYIKQKQFFDLTKNHREVALFAGNQLGKTEAAAFMMAVWLTGIYPRWWSGRRFPGAIRAWAVGDSLKMTRDTMQRKLCGEPGSKEAHGTGFIPKDTLIEDGIVLARGEGNAYDTIKVRHISGDISTCRFRTYSAGRVALQGETLDAVWLDEEPDDPSIYGECLTRVTATGGVCVITFTPLKGLTGIALRFLNEPSPVAPMLLCHLTTFAALRVISVVATMGAGTPILTAHYAMVTSRLPNARASSPAICRTNANPERLVSQL
jgi:phage terminase large subunit-like protein